jgi:TRAP-type mannitol/chloroaromatic compound transport system substrate-binding protein
MRTGSLEMGWAAAAYHKHINDAAALFDAVAGGLSSVQRMFWYEVGGGNELAQEMYDPFGVKHLSWVCLPPEDWAYTTFPLETVDDLKKLKMRTAGDGGEILSRMGASTVFMPGGELYEAMQRGVINACEYGGANEGYEIGLHEVYDIVYLSTSRAPSDGNIVGCSMTAFNALPDDLQGIVEYISETVLDDYYANTIIKDAVALQKIKDYGRTVLPLPKEIDDAYLAEAKKFYDEKVATGDDFFGRVLESQREFREYCDLKQISG